MSELNTENSIEEQGIPEIVLQVQPNNTVQAPVDTTLSVSGMAADAAAVGAALAALEAAIGTATEALFPIGSVYASVLDTPPAFFGTWVEFKMPMTHGDIEDGTRSYADGASTGTLHYWRRTA